MEYIFAALFGGVVFSAITFVILNLRNTKDRIRQQADFNAQIEAMDQTRAKLSDDLAESNNTRLDSEARNADLQNKVEELAAAIDQLNMRISDMSNEISHNQQNAIAVQEEFNSILSNQTKELADEAARLKNVAVTFEHWHKEMNSLMEQNTLMRTQNQEFAAIMASVGLICSDTGDPGGRQTGDHMTHYIDPNGLYAEVFQSMPEECLLPFKLLFDNDTFLLGKPYKSVGLSKIELSKIKTKYTCLGCGAAVWGRPALDLSCNPCKQVMVVIDDFGK